MILSNDFIKQLKDEVGKRFDFYLDENNTGICTLPFKDSLGDNFLIRIAQNGGNVKIDDAGIIQNLLFIMSETVGGAKSSRLVNSLIADFDAHFDTAEGVIELVSNQDEVTSKLLHFAKLLVTIDTMLVEIGKEAKETERPHRQSLGLRASSRIRRSLKPLIDIKKVNQRVLVKGLTVDDWMVDFAYKPEAKMHISGIDMVLLISVDLAVIDPIVKATYAFSRAMDIKAMHDKYDIRVAYDTHGQNSASEAGARFLKEHQFRDKAYSAIDLSKREEFAGLIHNINIEAGMPIVG